MNVCETHREQIDHRQDGIMNAAQEARLTAHLEHCADCCRYDAAQSALSGDLSKLARAANELAASRILKARTSADWVRIGRIAAALAFVALCTWPLLRQSSTKTPLEPSSIAINAIDDTPVPPLPIRFAAAIEPVDGESRFAVPVETINPRIHMVWMYDSVLSGVNPSPASAPSSEQKRS